MPEVTERLRKLQPANVEELARFRDAAWGAGDGARLELCRLLLAERFGGLEALASPPPPPPSAAGEVDPAKASAIADWATSPLFDAADRAYLAFTEQFSTSVAHISDQEVSALLEHSSEQEVFDFAVALYIIEMEMRMSIVARAMLTTTEASK
jgi:hypothetical protein